MRIALLISTVLISGCSFADPAPIRERPWFIPKPPNPNFAQAIMGVIYPPEGQFEEFTQEKLPVQIYAVILHERVHTKRQQNFLLLPWHILYSQDKDFRWKEEQEGYRVQLETLFKAGYAPEGLRDGFIQAVTDPYYREMVTEEEAGRWFDQEAANFNSFR